MEMKRTDDILSDFIYVARQQRYPIFPLKNRQDAVSVRGGAARLIHHPIADNKQRDISNFRHVRGKHKKKEKRKERTRASRRDRAKATRRRDDDDDVPYKSGARDS